MVWYIKSKIKGDDAGDVIKLFFILVVQKQILDTHVLIGDITQWWECIFTYLA